MADLSVIVPVYGCAGCLTELHRRITGVLRSLVSDYEIVLVEDCSHDNSWQVMSELAAKDPKIKALKLSRNFGQHAAITAGLAECTGEWAVVMDCDLQDPPEYIPYLYKKAQAGYDVVFAKRLQKQHSWFRKALARFYFRVLNLFNKNAIEGDYGSFSIISRKVINAYLGMQDRHRHYLLILYWLGFKSATIEYEHGQRFKGKSSYTLATLIRHALEGVLFQTTSLLRGIIYIGFLVSFLGLVLAAYYVYQYFAHAALPGWTSLSVLILVIGGFIILSTGITGMYLGKIFEQVKGRPLYVVDRKIVNGVEKQ